MSERSANAAETLNYQELRKMVECAASYRDQEVYIVVADGEWRVETMMPIVKEGTAVIRCKSPGKPGAPEPLELAQIGLYEKKPVDLLKLKVNGKEERADAVFWTAAAVEKFVVPYYASVYGDQAPKKLTDLIGILGTVRPDDDAVPPALLSRRDSTPFAVAHMPKSEYVQVDGGMVVLAADGDGNVSALSVSDYLKPAE